MNEVVILHLLFVLPVLLFDLSHIEKSVEAALEAGAIDTFVELAKQTENETLLTEFTTFVETIADNGIYKIAFYI